MAQQGIDNPGILRPDARQARVAVLVGSGLTAPQAAEALGISLSTVKTHLKHCFDKIGVHSEVALARLLSTLPINPAGGWN